MSSVVIWGCVLAAGYALKVALDVPAVVRMAIGVLICVAGWLIYIRSPVLSQSDRDILASVLRGREARVLRWLGVIPELQRAR